MRLPWFASEPSPCVPLLRCNRLQRDSMGRFLAGLLCTRLLSRVRTGSHSLLVMLDAGEPAHMSSCRRIRPPTDAESVSELCDPADEAFCLPLAQDIPAVNGSRGRITIYCVAETLNRDLLTKKLRERGPQFLLHSYPDVLYGRYHKCAAHRAAPLSSTCC